VSEASRLSGEQPRACGRPPRQDRQGGAEEKEEEEKERRLRRRRSGRGVEVVKGRVG